MLDAVAATLTDAAEGRLPGGCINPDALSAAGPATHTPSAR
jgi:hypothetical protein